MDDAALPFPASQLVRYESKINADPLVPLRVPALTIAFLHRLARQCDNPSKPLAEFLLKQSYSALEDELIRILLPQNVQELRVAHERFQREKEEALIDQNFERAASLRDATDSIKSQMQRVADTLPDIEPHHFVVALRNLGFEGPLDV